jgi:hypothetical protein
MVQLSQKRTCPFCHTRIVLGDCKIVGTNLVARDDTSPRGDKGPTPVDGDHALRSLPSKTPAREWYGGYPVIAPAPRARYADTPSKRLLASALGTPLEPVTRRARAEDLPARACTACRHPLPQDIDDRDFLTIAVVGTTGAGKSHYLASMIRDASRRQELRRYGVQEFVPDEATARRYHEDYFEPLFEDESLLPATAPNNPFQFRPLSFRVTLAGYEPCGLLFHDVAGEILADRHRRAELAPFVRQADGVIFLVDPVWLAPVRRVLATNGVRRSGGSNQADLLTACIQQMEPEKRAAVPYAITLSKSDLLVGLRSSRPRFADRPPDGTREWGEDLRTVDREVRTLLQDAEAHDLLAATEQLGKVSFHAVAALNADPVNGRVNDARPLRCLDPLAAVLSALCPRLRPAVT